MYLETVRYNSGGSNPWVADVNLYGGIGKGLVLGADLSLYAVGMYYYSALKYSQSKTLNLKALIEGFYNPTANKMIKDTARIYLRNISSPYAVVDSSLSTLDSIGMGNFIFSNAVNSVPYYIVIRHRNGLETWSAAGNSFTSGNLSYDFTLSSTQAYGNNLILKGSKYCIYSGDVNQDGIVDAGDLSLVDNGVINSLSGYVISDVNGDQIVDASALSITDNNVYNSILVRNPIVGDSLDISMKKDSEKNSVRYQKTKMLYRK